ncbi:MAG: arginase family protein, partial [Primorskyibacter sp.]
MALEDAGTQTDTALTATDPRGLRYENVFAGVPSFLRRVLSHDPTGAQICVLGLPFDQAVTHRPGARFGPRALREASSLLAGDVPFGWDYDVLSSRVIYDVGDVPYDYAVPQGFAAAAEARVAQIAAAGAVPLSLGGDHSATLPVLRALAAKHGPLGLLQVDAHTDTWPETDPTRMCHGTYLARALDEGLVDPDRSCLLGIRTSCPDTRGLEIITAPEIHATPLPDLIARVRRRLGAGAQSGPCYLTFDIDGLDPAFAPGTGTPEVGGPN